MSTTTILRSRYAICQKGQLFGLVAIAITPTQNVVSRLDPRRDDPISYKGFETPVQAETWFNEYVATTRDNGWKITYNGPANRG